MRRLAFVCLGAIALSVALEGCSFLIDFDELQSGLERRSGAASSTDAGDAGRHRAATRCLDAAPADPDGGPCAVRGHADF
jgi:hypothetical protein